MEDTDLNKVVPIGEDENQPLKIKKERESKKSIFSKISSAVVGNIAGAISFIGKGLFGGNK